ncbi:hypothetical protein [Hymenobacter coccineus]|uniref:Uncharacterized protein n=1 Tax=Hymenobacter coccineus TaxID=1908235 RepID=A0A1G1T9H0_9BACT|nr:hypothetical protein [Hymenobacter coccineus]OGX87516.1 hypothetical protein BEN49_10640 [Hymenobacter coccineus]
MPVFLPRTAALAATGPYLVAAATFAAPTTSLTRIAMTTPRIRQLRRDKTLFNMAMNAVRLHLEEADRMNQQPQLREAPDAELQLIQYSIDQWAGLGAGYIMRKFRCPMPQALQLLGELQGELKMNVPVAELRQVPFTQSLALPPAFGAAPPPVAAAE